MRKYTQKYLQFYKQIRKNQNYVCVKKYCTKMENKISIQKIFNELENFIDISDPDINLPNITHCLQTAEGIRNDNHPEWLQLIGFIHDIGKIVYLKGCDKDGTSINSQWGIVGDTFITGTKIPDLDDFSEFNKLNKDNIEHNEFYKEKCGLNNCLCSFGHDEYLFRIMLNNKNSFPPEAYFIVRYHSLYLLHKYNQYNYLLNDSDIKKIRWLKLFNKYDLYTKKNKIYEKKKLNSLKEYYFKLFKKFFGSYTIKI